MFLTCEFGSKLMVLDGSCTSFAMEFILQNFHRVQAAEARESFAEGFSSRKLAEALQVKRSFLQMQKRHIRNQIRCVENS